MSSKQTETNKWTKVSNKRKQISPKKEMPVYPSRLKGFFENNYCVFHFMGKKSPDINRGFFIRLISTTNAHFFRRIHEQQPRDRYLQAYCGHHVP